MSKSSWTSLMKRGYSVTASASYSGAFDAGVSASHSSNVSQRQAFKNAATYIRTVSVGAPPRKEVWQWLRQTKRGDPMPISYQLASICTLFPRSKRRSCTRALHYREYCTKRLRRRADGPRRCTPVKPLQCRWGLDCNRPRSAGNRFFPPVTALLATRVDIAITGDRESCAVKGHGQGIARHTARKLCVTVTTASSCLESTIPITRIYVKCQRPNQVTLQPDQIIITAK